MQILPLSYTEYICFEWGFKALFRANNLNAMKDCMRAFHLKKIFNNFLASFC